jgi:hypothetical protein
MACRVIARRVRVPVTNRSAFARATARQPRKLSGLGLTGLEPVTLRLSSACSNQLSYRPVSRLRRGILDSRLRIFDLEQPSRKRAFSKSQIANPKLQIQMSASSRSRGTTARQPRKRFRNVALRMHDLKPISDIARIEPCGSGRKVQCMFSIATASI